MFPEIFQKNPGYIFANLAIFKIWRFANIIQKLVENLQKCHFFRKGAYFFLLDAVGIKINIIVNT